MAAIKNKIDPRAHDGHGTRTEPMMTGHGAPASASGRGNEPIGKVRPNNWGAKSLRKLGPTSGATSPGYDRFVQPTMAQTAVVPPGGVGNPIVVP